MIYGIIFAASVVIAVLLHFYRKPKDLLTITIFINDLKIKSKNMALSLTTTQFVEGQVTPADRKGNPAAVETGSVSYTSSNEAVAVVEEDPADETKFKIVAKGIGVAQIDFSADADTGEGVKTITGFVGVEILPAEAVGFGVTFSEVKEQE